MEGARRALLARRWATKRRNTCKQSHHSTTISYCHAEKLLTIPYFADDRSLTKAAYDFRPRFRHRGAWFRKTKPLTEGFYVFTLDPRAKTTKTIR